MSIGQNQSTTVGQNANIKVGGSMNVTIGGTGASAAAMTRQIPETMEAATATL